MPKFFHCIFSTFFIYSLFMAMMTKEAVGQPKQEIWYHTGYPGNVVGPRIGMSALMGPTKMPAIFEAIWRHRLLNGSQIHTDSPEVVGKASPAPPIDLESLRQVHTDRYLKALFTGEPISLATSQGLPFWNESIAKGWLLNVGGLYAAAQTARDKNSFTANLGHGYHHATVNRGRGFCTINGLVVVAKKLIRDGKAKKVMIIDLDHHEGDGTGECLIGDPSIWNITIFGARMGGPSRTENHHPFEVDHRAFAEGSQRDIHYLAAISSILLTLIKKQKPDLIIYQAGMDPYDSAGISSQALTVRDAYVFALARALHKPVTWVLAGGYADIDTLVHLHTTTLKMANEVLIKINPGDRIIHQALDPYKWSVQKGIISFPDWSSLLKGKPRVYQPAAMSEKQVKEFVTLRNQLYEKERLPDEEIRSAYQKLFQALSSAIAK